MNMNIQAGDVELWFAPLAAAYDAEKLAVYASLLDAGERVRWHRFQYPADRQRFLVGRAFLRTVLANCLGDTAPAALQFRQLAHGKPELDGLHAGKLQFNLSHTDAVLVLAVSRRHAVGVDVEAVTRKVELMALAQRYFAAHEYAELRALDASAQRERFFTLWTLKEAWLKARGLGLQVPLCDFSFDLTSAHPLIAFTQQLDERPHEWQFRVLARDQYRIALAVHCAAAPLQIQLRTWTE